MTDTQITLMTEEYKALKAEQAQRIILRDRLVYASILAAVATVGSTPVAGQTLQLLLPPVCLVLGWTYLMTDQMVSAIGRYLREDLGTRLAALVDAPVFGWEHDHKGDRRRRQRKAMQLVIDLSVFCLPGLVAVVAYWLGPVTPALVATSIVEAVGIAVLAWQIVAYAEVLG